MALSQTEGEFLTLHELVRAAHKKLDRNTWDYLIGGTGTETTLLRNRQALVCKTMRPVLDSLAIEHHTCTRLDELEFVADRTIKQAVATQAPACLILSPLLTGGKVLKP